MVICSDFSVKFIFKKKKKKNYITIIQMQDRQQDINKYQITD